MPVSNDSFTALFADDTAIAVTYKNYNEAVEQLQTSLNKIRYHSGQKGGK
jgi:hypothetical protein